jgi:hypothetical protein
MTKQQRLDLLVAQMTTVLAINFETTPGFSARLTAYREAGLSLHEITTDLDRRAVLASIHHRLFGGKSA